MQPWSDAWQESLYGAAGFYRQPSGPAGHFRTSSHGPAGRLLASAIATLAHAEGCSRVIDIGAGRGELLNRLAGSDLDLLGVDVVARPVALDPRIGWLVAPGGAELPVLPPGGAAVALANEWLDVVPCPVAEADAAGTLREVLVAPDGSEALGTPVGESATCGAAESAWVERWWPGPHRPGDRVEIGLPRDRAYAALLALVPDGVVVAVDYGHRLADPGGRPRSGTLTGYRGGRQVAPRPGGTCDLTAHVAMDSLSAGRLQRQRDVLAGLGVNATRPPSELARSDPRGYLAGLEHASAAGELLGPPLGDFWWALTRATPTAGLA